MASHDFFIVRHRPWAQLRPGELRWDPLLGTKAPPPEIECGAGHLGMGAARSQGFGRFAIDTFDVSSD
jgi:hypothetical protein